jgi:NADPH:quinone reductase-like Zn-dependent oxidoreductase
VRAVVYERFGGPEVLELRDWPRPELRSGEVLVAVHAVGVNPVDAQNRTDGAWAELEPPVIPGYDFSGVVERVGGRAAGWAVGDEGAGTIAIELESAGPIDTAVVQIGDGALISGIARWLKSRDPQPRVVGVCASGAPAMAESLAAGRPVSVEGA